MNTSELQKKHSKIYEDFFTSNYLVVSAPFLINWSGDLHPDFNGVSIKQKVPLRLYVGVQKNVSKENSIGKIFSYDYCSDSFEVQEGENYASYGNLLLSEVNNYIPKEKGVVINILTEIPRTLGLGHNSILSLCISTVINLILEEDYTLELVNIPQKNIQDVLINSKILNSILLMSLKLDVAINGKMGISLKIASFFDSYYPIVSFKDKSPHIINDEDLNKMRFYGIRMNEIRLNSEDISFPFDFGVIMSDKPVLRENLKNIQHTPHLTSSEKEILVKKFSSIMSQAKTSHTNFPKFYHFLESKEDVIYNVYGSMMGAISIETLNSFGRVLSSHYSDEVLSRFFLTINKIRYGNNIVRDSSSYFLSFIDGLLSAINLSSSEFAVFPNDTLIMGGTITYVSYSAKNRHVIQSGIETMQLNRQGVKMIYSSASDGLAHRGLILEQHIDRGIVSKHLRNNSRVLKDSKGAVIVGDVAYLISNDQYDLILDLFNGKMYHKGLRLTSKDISSQSTTIEVISLLMNSEHHEISNEDMSYSSYAKNKNELNSKIIMPLEKRAKQKVNKDFVLRATGSLTNFSIYIKHNTLNIAFLDKKK